MGRLEICETVLSEYAENCALVGCGPEKMVLYASHAFAKNLGYDLEQVEDRSYYDFIHPVCGSTIVSTCFLIVLQDDVGNVQSQFEEIPASGSLQRKSINLYSLLANNVNSEIPRSYV